jgi:hypothetical protein
MLELWHREFVDAPAPGAAGPLIAAGDVHGPLG